MYSNLADAYTNPIEIATRGAHFYDEAKRILEEGDGIIELPTIQGLCSLAVWLATPSA
jgi:hypothetical protein